MYRIEILDKDFQAINTLAFERYSDSISVFETLKMTDEFSKWTILALRDVDDNQILEIVANRYAD